MIDNIKAVVAFILVFVFCSNGYLALEETFPAIREIYWFIFLFGASALFLLLTPIQSLGNMPKPAFIWIILFLASMIIAYSYSSRGPWTITEGTRYIKGIATFISMFILLTDPKIVKVAFYALVLVIVVNAGVNLTEFFTDKIEWSSIPGRAAGWHFNANQSAKFLVMSLIFASIATPKKLLWPLIIIATAGALVTFSRSGWVELFVAIVGISLINNTPVGQKISLLNIKPSSFIAMTLGATIASILLVSLFSGQAYEMIKDTPMEEYLSKDTIGRMSGDFTDDSAQDRKDILVTAVKIGLNNPMTGVGLSYTTEWEYPVGTHNDFARLFAERGIPGLLLYLSLLGILWFTGGRHAKLFVMILTFSSIATHNTLEEPGMYVFFALAMLYNRDVNKLDSSVKGTSQV